MDEARFRAHPALQRCANPCLWKCNLIARYLFFFRHDGDDDDDEEEGERRKKAGPSAWWGWLVGWLVFEAGRASR